MLDWECWVIVCPHQCASAVIGCRMSPDAIKTFNVVVSVLIFFFLLLLSQNFNASVWCKQLSNWFVESVHVNGIHVSYFVLCKDIRLTCSLSQSCNAVSYIEV